MTVALIGPDGAGKTSIARRLEQLLPMPVKYIYMGVNPESSNYLLPSTRAVHAVRRWLAPRQKASGDSYGPTPEASKGIVRRVSRALRSFLRLGNRLAEEWHRAWVASVHRRRGSIVIFDRHFFADYYAYDIVPSARRSPSRRLHGFILSRLYPRPDLTIYLDAPADVLLERKGEGTLTSLARRRREYLELSRVLRGFAVVDASRALDQVTEDVIDVIYAFANRASGERRSPEHHPS